VAGAIADPLKLGDAPDGSAAAMASLFERIAAQQAALLQKDEQLEQLRTLYAVQFGSAVECAVGSPLSAHTKLPGSPMLTPPRAGAFTGSNVSAGMPEAVRSGCRADDSEDLHEAVARLRQEVEALRVSEDCLLHAAVDADEELKRCAVERDRAQHRVAAAEALAWQTMLSLNSANMRCQQLWTRGRVLPESKLYECYSVGLISRETMTNLQLYLE
jgi:hypothetical protein